MPAMNDFKAIVDEIALLNCIISDMVKASNETGIGEGDIRSTLWFTATATALVLAGEDAVSALALAATNDTEAITARLIRAEFGAES